MRLVINEDDCNGEGRQFETYVSKHHPEIEIDYRERTSGVGGGLFYDLGETLDGPDHLWDEYCNAVEVQT